MKTRIKNSIAQHFKTTHVLKAILIMFAISFVADLCARGVQNMYQKYSPTDWRYEYESITPDYYGDKEYFAEGELLRFESKVWRHKDVEMQRQDKAFCKQNGSIIKYPTQLWPENGTEYMGRGKKDSSWKYYVEIDSIATECKMCGTAIGFTPLGYKKHWPYCIDWFLVNG